MHGILHQFLHFFAFQTNYNTFFFKTLKVLIATTLGYELVCPASSEWHLRARAKNCTGTYVCLQRLPENYYIEKCNGPDVSNKGNTMVPIYLILSLS